MSLTDFQTRLASFFYDQLSSGTELTIPTASALGFPDAQSALDTDLQHLVGYSESGKPMVTTFVNNPDILHLYGYDDLKESPDFLTCYRVDYGKLTRLVGDRKLPRGGSYDFVPNSVLVALLSAVIEIVETYGTAEVIYESTKASHLIRPGGFTLDTGFPQVDESLDLNRANLSTVLFPSGITSVTSSGVSAVSMLDIRTILPASPVELSMQDTIFKGLIHRFIQNGTLTNNDPTMGARLWSHIVSDINKGNFSQYKARYVDLYNRVRRLFYTVPVDIVWDSSWSAEEWDQLFKSGIFYLTYVNSRGNPTSAWITGDYSLLKYFYTDRELFHFRGVRDQIDFLKNYPGGVQNAVDMGLVTHDEVTQLEERAATMKPFRPRAKNPDIVTVYNVFKGNNEHLYQSVNIQSILGVKQVG